MSVVMTTTPKTTHNHRGSIIPPFRCGAPGETSPAPHLGSGSVAYRSRKTMELGHARQWEFQPSPSRSAWGKKGLCADCFSPYTAAWEGGKEEPVLGREKPFHSPCCHRGTVVRRLLAAVFLFSYRPGGCPTNAPSTQLYPFLRIDVNQYILFQDKIRNGGRFRVQPPAEGSNGRAGFACLPPSVSRILCIHPRRAAWNPSRKV